MHRTSLLLALALAIAGVSAEYIWTGTEWKWKNPETPGGASDTLRTNTDLLDSTSEGSGDGNTWDDEDEDNYDDDYDDDYDYDKEVEVSKQDNNKYDFNDYNKNTKKEKKQKEKKQKEKKNRNKDRDSQFYPSNSNSAILPATDDEDLFNGSGEGDYDYVPPTFNKPVTESPKTNNPTVYEKEEEDYDYDTYPVYGENEDYDDDFNPTPDPPRSYNPTTTISTTIRSFTTKKPSAPRTSRPEAGPGHGAHNPIPVNRPASFFAQPGILAAVIGGAVVGLLCAILLVMFIVYRMRKKDEGSYALDDSKRSHNVNSYSKPPNREFYA